MYKSEDITAEDFIEQLGRYLRLDRDQFLLSMTKPGFNKLKHFTEWLNTLIKFMDWDEKEKFDKNYGTQIEDE